MAVSIQITKFKLRQHPWRLISPDLMLAKLTIIDPNINPHPPDRVLVHVSLVQDVVPEERLLLVEPWVIPEVL